MVSFTSAIGPDASDIQKCANLLSELKALANNKDATEHDLAELAGKAFYAHNGMTQKYDQHRPTPFALAARINAFNTELRRVRTMFKKRRESAEISSND